MLQSQKLKYASKKTSQITSKLRQKNYILKRKKNPKQKKKSTISNFHTIEKKKNERENENKHIQRHKEKS